MRVPRGGLRLRLIGVVAVGAVLALGALALAFNVAFRASLDSDADKILRARATAALDAVSVEAGHVRVRERPQPGVPDTPIWVYDGTVAIERARAPENVQVLADELARTPPQSRQDAREETRLLSVPVLSKGERVGTVIAGLSAEPYESSASRALTFSLALVGLVSLLIIGLARLLVDRALRPVDEMTVAAADWTEHDLDHRFNAGEPHDELTALAATFDGMLDRLAVSLRHEQRFSAELSHELRTPLAAILAEAEVALRREREGGEYRDALDRIVSRSRQLQRILETLLMAERAGLSATAEGTAPGELIERAIEAHVELASDRGVEIGWRERDSLPGLEVDVDVDTGERILSPLIENACRYARSRVDLEARALPDAFTILIDDDGRGVPAGDLEAIFAPGFHGTDPDPDPDGTGPKGSGAGLGLALSRRLARAVGGEVRAIESASGGRFEVTIPARRAEV